jgi:hypothetical protein
LLFFFLLVSGFIIRRSSPISVQPAFSINSLIQLPHFYQQT